MEDRERHRFIIAVDRSFLPEEVKDMFRKAAHEGVTERLWSELNDRLIASIVDRARIQREADVGIDDEVQRFSAEYEAEKARIDRELWDRLKAIPEDDKETRRKMWAEYERDIDVLQRKLLTSVRNTSSTVLKDVILQVMALEA